MSMTESQLEMVVNDDAIFDEVGQTLIESAENDGICCDTMNANSNRLLPASKKPQHSNQKRKIKKRWLSPEDQPTDGRKYFVSRFYECVNTGDLVALREFMNENFAPNLVYTERMVHYVPVYDLYIEYYGIDAILAYYSVLLQAMPDLVLTVFKSRLTLRQDKSSYIVGKINVRGTHLYKVLMTDPVHELNNYVSRWNPFSYLYSMVAGGKPSAGSSNTSRSDGDALTPSAATNEDMTSLTYCTNNEHRLAADDDDDKQLPLSSSQQATSIEHPQIKIASPTSAAALGEAKEQPVAYHLDCSIVMYINPQCQVYRIDILKRKLPDTLKMDPFDSSSDQGLFGEIEEEFSL